MSGLVRAAFGWIVPALAAAAVLVAPEALLVLGSGESAGARVAAVAILLAAGGSVWLLVRARRPESSAVATLGVLGGAALSVWVLLVLAVLIGYAVAPGSCGGQPADAIGVVGLLVAYVSTGAWALRAGRRALWALPAGFVLGAVWFLGLAAAFPGPSGCGD